MRGTSLAGALSLLLVAAPASAQTPTGDRRLTFEGRPVATGIVMRAAETWPRTRADSTRPAVRQPPAQANGSPRSWASRHPAALGFLIGAGTGAALGAAQCGPDSGCDYSRATGAIQGALPLGLVGALVGWVASRVGP